jgi:hypothetical protein
MFQLLMYWDGLVEDGIPSPTAGFVIAADHAPALMTLATALNARKDANGNNYNFNIGTWKPLVRYP